MSEAGLHLHLDPLGGVAGDMFVAALLDAWPEYAEGVRAAVAAASPGPDICVAHQAFSDGILSGSRFAVSAPDAEAPPTRLAFATAPAHSHIAWAELREQLSRADLTTAVKARAIAIFTGLAEAEASVHACAPEAVSFHEVGAWDSVADIVAAAWLIEQIGASSWSIGALPLGSGRVASAHGQLPVPAPATVLLLRGFAFTDDGRAGERVTPTGAAILRHLAPAQSPGRSARSLARVGYGFGTRRLEGMSNVLRVLAFEPLQGGALATDTVGVLDFDIDDQTGEDLALGLERLRALPGVIDVTQRPVIGKRGRLASSVQVLTDALAVDAVAHACFEETTTIGLRLRTETRLLLAREEVRTADGLRVKRVQRPGGVTAKTDIAELAAHDAGHAAREHLRRRAADAALDPSNDLDE